MMGKKTYLDKEHEARIEDQKQLVVRIQSQLDSKFYNQVDEFRDDVKFEQLAKAAEKYDKPFDPDDWTPKELLTHAFQENYDQSVYIVGLYKKIEKLEEKMKAIQKDLEDQISNTHFWYMKVQELKKGSK